MFFNSGVPLFRYDCLEWGNGNGIGYGIWDMGYGKGNGEWGGSRRWEYGMGGWKREEKEEEERGGMAWWFLVS